MGYTTTDFSTRSVRAEAKAQAGETQPIGLPYIFFWGFMFSLAVVLVLVWLAASYETQEFIFWRAEPRMNPDTFFGVIRNGVTAAAALGVGVTLFFSYRRQQTAERTLLISAEAQRTAVETQKTGVQVQKTAAAAQALANKNFKLVARKHDLEVVAALRARYAEAASQIASDKVAVRLAGLHALGSLADEWKDRSDRDEQQLCIDLFCSVVRTEPVEPLEGEKNFTSSPFLEAGWQILTTRMSSTVDERKSWKDMTIDLRRSVIPDLEEWILENGELQMPGVLASPYVFSKLKLRGGILDLDGIRNAQGKNVVAFFSCQFTGGNLFLNNLHPSVERVYFLRCIFDGGHLLMLNAFTDLKMDFEDCTFIRGRAQVIQGIGQQEGLTMRFEHCTFEAPVIQIPCQDTDKVILSFDDRCTFSGDAAAMTQDPRSAMITAASHD
ncbi:hypothetical protein ACX80U_05750 [Arthrobacter sp. TmT3-37]